MTAVITETPVEETVDLEDLDLLDDDRVHVACIRCVPLTERWPGMLVTAACGTQVLVPAVWPDKRCEPCWELIGKTCPKCGAR